jgi:hypothetical protein
MTIKFYKFLIIAVLAFVCACNSVVSQTNKESNQIEQTVIKSETKDDVVFTELNDSPFDKTPEKIQKVWKKFTANGQYRLAQPSEINVSKSVRPYVYIWGDLNYDKRIEDDHLAAIVVDMTKNDQNRFCLVIFSPIKNAKDKYDINWLYRDKDLSKTTVSRASGEFYVEQFSDDGNRKACSVNWNKKRQIFECN